MNADRRGWIRLAFGLAAIVALIGLIHAGTNRLGGTAGRFIEENRNKGLEVYAYVYSEVGDLEEFLDDESGRYGKAALSELIDKGSTDAAPALR